jgi:multiple sugar transport system substrate-binding protein
VRGNQVLRFAAIGVVGVLLAAGCSSSKHSTAAPSSSGAAAPAGSSAPAAAGSSAPAAAGSSAPAAAGSSAPAAAGSSAPAPAAPGAVNLTFWSWVPQIAKVVDLWNSTHPDIHVTVNTAAQGDALYTKLLTAAKAGNAPDLSQVEYQALPSMVSNGVIDNIAGKIGSVQSDYSAGIWSQVTLGTNAVYGLPQDSGPMMLYYRVDLFKKYGLTVPATWADFATDAATLRTKDPSAHLTTFSSGDPGWFAGLAAQSGAKWWGLSGSTWSVNINDAATQKVASYWNDLVSKGTIAGEPMFTPQWNKDLDSGALLTWPSAIWAPGVLTTAAPDTKGDWAVAPMPQWTAGANVTGFWGGSSTAVIAKTKHEAQAIQFATWLNTDPTAVQALVLDGGIYPAATPGQSVPALQQAPPFFPNEPDFYKTAAGLASTAVGFTWGPDVTVTYNTYTDAFGKAITSKTAFSAAVNTMQTTTVADMKKSGFTLAGS